MPDAKPNRGRNSRRGTLGNLESLGLPEIIQSLSLGQKTARLSLTSEGRWGHIWLEDGQATHAQTRRLSGELAFYEMIAWKTGEFLLEPDVRTDTRSLNHDPMYLVMEGSRRVDESADVRPADHAAPAVVETIPLSVPREISRRALPPPRRRPPVRVIRFEAVPPDRRGRRRMWLLAAAILPLCVVGMWLPSLGLVAPPPDRATEAQRAATPLPIDETAGSEVEEPDGSELEEPRGSDRPAPRSSATRHAANGTPSAHGAASDTVAEAPAGLSGAERRAYLIDVSPGAIAPAYYELALDASAPRVVPAPKAFLRIVGKSSVRSGRLSLSVDGTEVYTRDFMTPPGKKGLFKRMFGKAESFETTITVEPGRHEIRARLSLDEGGAGFGSSAVLEIDAGATREVKLLASRKTSRPVTLKIE